MLYLKSLKATAVEAVKGKKSLLLNLLRKLTTAPRNEWKDEEMKNKKRLKVSLKLIRALNFFFFL